MPARRAAEVKIRRNDDCITGLPPPVVNTIELESNRLQYTFRWSANIETSAAGMSTVRSFPVLVGWSSSFAPSTSGALRWTRMVPAFKSRSSIRSAVWADSFPDTRLSLPTMLVDWFGWQMPDGFDPWTETAERIPCPPGLHLDRQAQLEWDAFRCSRHTRTEWWGLLDFAVRKRSMTEFEALEFCNEIENKILLGLAQETSEEKDDG